MTVQNGLKEDQKVKQEPSLDQDIIQKCIGILGRWHLWVCFAIFLVKFPVAWHQLSIVFVAAPIDFVCSDNTTDRCSEECPQHVFDRSIFTETIASQWDLVCEKKQLANFAQTVTMLGILCGNMVFGYLSDRFGRKMPLLWAVILQSISGTIAAFSPYFVLFLIMRFLAALATCGTMITSFVLVMEIVGTKWRTVLGILYQIPFNLGHLSLPLISYFLRDWRYFQLAISLPSIFLVIYYWVLPESPRWLLAIGRKEEALQIMKYAAEKNDLPTGHIEEDVEVYLQKKVDTEKIEKSKGNVVDLVRTPIMRMYTICICFNWLVCGLCFYGVSQFIGQLGGNIFINVALSAVIQLPSTFFACWATKALGRKKTLIIANLVAGVSLLLLGIVPSDPAWIKSALSTIGMFGLALAFPTVYIYSGELFPTVARNVGVGACSVSARIGSMAAPFVASLAGAAAWLPPAIFGALPLIGAVLCVKLPETLDCRLPDTIEEAEQVGVVNGRSRANGEVVEME